MRELLETLNGGLFEEIAAGFVLLGVAGLVIFFVVRLRKVMKDTAKMETGGSRAYCAVTRVEEVRTQAKGRVVEYKNIYYTTPLGTKGVYSLSFSSVVEEGDSILIAFDPSDADVFRVVQQNGAAVIKKKR